MVKSHTITEIRHFPGETALHMAFEGRQLKVESWKLKVEVEKLKSWKVESWKLKVESWSWKGMNDAPDQSEARSLFQNWLIGFQHMGKENLVDHHSLTRTS